MDQLASAKISQGSAADSTTQASNMINYGEINAYKAELKLHILNHIEAMIQRLPL